MGFFSEILQKLGMGNADAASTPGGTAAKPSPSAKAAPTSGAPSATKPSPAAPAPTRTAAPASTPNQPAPPSPTKSVEVVDVVAQLERRAAASSQTLNWRTSIVDLLKLLDIDSSLTARKALATELGCPADLMGDSAQMNMWLHKTVLERIAANGGNVPKELLD